jgi:hypothetical protein
MAHGQGDEEAGCRNCCVTLPRSENAETRRGVKPQRAPASGLICAPGSAKRRSTAQGGIRDGPRDPERLDTRMNRSAGLTGQLPRGSEGLVDPQKRLMAAVLQTVLDDCRGSAYRRRLGVGTPRTLGPCARRLPAWRGRIARGRSGSRICARRSVWMLVTCGTSCSGRLVHDETIPAAQPM